jgi:hypothetical protein
MSLVDFVSDLSRTGMDALRFSSEFNFRAARFAGDGHTACGPTVYQSPTDYINDRTGVV